MRRELKVRSTVIDWQEQTLTITDMAGKKHTIPLDQEIHVTMVGYPDQETRTMQARELGEYMTRGYIIQKIEYEYEEDVSS